MKRMSIRKAETFAALSLLIALAGALVVSSQTRVIGGPVSASVPVHLFGQTATIANTIAYTNNTGANVTVRGTCTAHTTVQGSAGTVLCSVITPDAFAVNSPTVDMTSTHSSRSASFTMTLSNGDGVHYSTTVAGATGSPQYELVINVEQMPQ